MKEPIQKNFTDNQKSDPGLLSRILLILLVIVLVGLTMWISGPVPSDAELAGIATPTPTLNPRMTGPAPMEPFIEQTPTSGVVVGTIVIVLIILIGTAITILKMKDRSALKKK